jgi:hypothetical protein
MANHNFGNRPTIKFDTEEVKSYLDGMIRYWRKERDRGSTPLAMARCYIDAYQSVRVSIFGKTLEKEDEVKNGIRK